MRTDFVIPETLVNSIERAYNNIHGTGVREISDFDNKTVYEYGKRPEDAPFGVLIGSERKEGKLWITETKQQSHVLLSAATGTGKTQGYVYNTLYNANKGASYIVADAKGELCANTYHRLCETYGKENVHVFNFRNPFHSQHRFNPFARLAAAYKQSEGLPPQEKKIMRATAISELQKLVDQMFEVSNTKEPEWQQAAKMLIEAYFLALFEDCLDSSKGVQPSDVTLERVVEMITRIDWNAEGGEWGDGGFFYKRPKGSLAKERAKIVLGASSRGTRTSYFSIFQLFISQYNNPNTLEITKKADRTATLKKQDIPEEIENLKALMKIASKNLDFEKCIEIRDTIAKLKLKLAKR